MGDGGGDGLQIVGLFRCAYSKQHEEFLHILLHSRLSYMVKKINITLNEK